MLMPSIFGENLFDDFFGDFPFYYDKDMKNVEKKLYGRKASHVMKTDIKETDNGYELVVDLPGFTKDEVQATLENGYLTISAEKGLDKDEKEKETGHYIRKERYAGACSRSFYVGEDVEQADIKAEFKHGILTLFVPKKAAKPAAKKPATKAAPAKKEKEDINNLEKELANDINVTTKEAVDNILELKGYTESKTFEPTLFQGIMIGKLNEFTKMQESGRFDGEYTFNTLTEYGLPENDGKSSIEEMAFIESVKEYTKLNILKALKLESFDKYKVSDLANEYAYTK